MEVDIEGEYSCRGLIGQGGKWWGIAGQEARGMERAEVGAREGVTPGLA